MTLVRLTVLSVAAGAVAEMSWSQMTESMVALSDRRVVHTRPIVATKKENMFCMIKK